MPKITVGGMQRSKLPQMKKVSPPIVPELAAKRNSNGGRNSPFRTVPMPSSVAAIAAIAGGKNADDSYSTTPAASPMSMNTTSSMSMSMSSSSSSSMTTTAIINKDVCDNGIYMKSSDACPSPVQLYSSFQYPASQSLNQVLLSANRPVVGSNVVVSFNQPHSPLPGEDTYSTGYLLDCKYPPTYQQQTSLEDQGIDVQSPGRDSPGSSGSSSGSGCRHSITSLDSGRASSSAYDGRSGHVYLAGPNQHRLSGHSYESSTSLRQSYHSSNSSLGSMDRLDEGTGSVGGGGSSASGIGGSGGCTGGAPYSSAQINVCKLLNDGVPESEVLRRWLAEHRFEEYFHLFVQAGYDIPTISRMTPEDLVAIGITKPSHRKKLKSEIGKLNVSDGLPDYIPTTLDEWLRLLRLDGYYDCLMQQGHKTVEDVLGFAWEDLEEIGIQKLGHQKKIMLAIKRVKDIQSGVKRFSSVTAENHPPLEVKCRILPPPGVLGASSSIGLGIGMGMGNGNNNNSYACNYMQQQQEVTVACQKPSSVTSASAAAVAAAAAAVTAPSLNSPMTNENLPDFRTFHHPPSEAVEYVPCGAYGPPPSLSSSAVVANTSSPSHIIYRPDIVAIQVRHPSGAKSLENLEDGRDPQNPPNRHRTFLQVDTRWNSTTCDDVSDSATAAVATSVSSSVQLHHQHQQQQQLSQQHQPLQDRAWRRGSFDDGDLTPTNELKSCDVVVEGGGTLPRPKVSIKPRPVAKIMAKTRFPTTNSGQGNGNGNCGDIDCLDIDKRASTGGNGAETVAIVVNSVSSPRRSLPGSPLNSILKATSTVGGKKVPPPPPPKRSNSIKGERKGRVNVGNDGGGGAGVIVDDNDSHDYSNEQLFASCVKSIASKFGLTRKNEWNSHETSPSLEAQSSSSSGNTGQMDVESDICEGSDRTPPSPAPSSPVHLRRDVSMISGGGGGGSGGVAVVGGQSMNANSSGCVSPDSSCSPVFHASSSPSPSPSPSSCKRNESTSSFDSTVSTASSSSTDSNSHLPFANENVGTIKQRANKPTHQSIVTLDLAYNPRVSPAVAVKNGPLAGTRSAPATPKRRSSLGSERMSSAALVELHDVDRNDDLIKPFTSQDTGDVLNDIDNMLANLTEELDAMLTSDLQNQ